MRRRGSVGGVINRGARGRIGKMDRLRCGVSTWRRREVRRRRARGDDVGRGGNRACQITGFQGDRVYRRRSHHRDGRLVELGICRRHGPVGRVVNRCVWRSGAQHDLKAGGIAARGKSLSKPNTSTSALVPTYTFPLTTVGVANLIAAPSVSLPLVKLESYQRVETLVAS